jgi:hypothetical protein
VTRRNQCYVPTSPTHQSLPSPHAASFKTLHQEIFVSVLPIYHHHAMFPTSSSGKCTFPLLPRRAAGNCMMTIQYRKLESLISGHETRN